MKIGRVEFAGAVAEPGEPPPELLPQVAFAGRSNVGKSSLLNLLVGRNRLARVSKRPGKTQQINFFRVDRRFFLVDLPGYGFARAPERVREGWGPLVESYLQETDELLGVVQLVDSRHEPTALDRQMLRYLARLRIPSLFVLTKADKLTRSERSERVRRAREELGVPEDQLLLTSAKTGEGRDDLLRSVAALLEGGDGGGGDAGKSGRSAVTPG